MRIGLLLFIILLSPLVGAETSLSIEKDFSKWHIFTSDFKAPSHLNQNKVQAWGSFLIHVSSKNSLILITKGYSPAEVDQLLNEKRLRAQLWKFLIPQSFAETDCSLRKSLDEAGSEIKKITAESILSSCEWNPVEILKESIRKIIAEAKGILSLDLLEKINQAIESVKIFVRDFKSQILPGLSKLAASAPDVVNSWACTKIRKEIPLIALSFAAPQFAARRIPLVISESMNEVRFLVSEPVAKVIKEIADSGQLKSEALKAVARMSPNQPDVFKDIQVHQKNLEWHAAKHAKEFSSKKDLQDYYRALDQFMVQKDPNHIYFTKPDGKSIKFNSSTGEMLVVSSEGNFVTFFRVKGLTEDERMLKFLNTQIGVKSDGSDPLN